MRTATLTGLSLTLLGSGLAVSAIGLHPAVNNLAAAGTGVLLAVGALFPWHTAAAQRAAALTADRLAAARRDGFLTAVDLITHRGLLDPPPGTPCSTTATQHADLRIITYTPPERTAQ